MLRREGLYSSHIVDWRRTRDAGALAGLGAPRRVHGRAVTRNPSRRSHRLHCPNTQCWVWVVDRWQGVAVRVAKRGLLGVAVLCWCWYLRGWILLTARQWWRRAH